MELLYKYQIPDSVKMKKPRSFARTDPTLRAYTQHFNKEMLEVLDCHVSIKVQMFRKKLVQESHFYNSLTMSTYRNMVDVLQHAAELIKLDYTHKLTIGEQLREKRDRYCRAKEMCPLSRYSSAKIAQPPYRSKKGQLM